MVERPLKSREFISVTGDLGAGIRRLPADRLAIRFQIGFSLVGASLAFDDSIRDMGRYGVQDGDCYVSDTLVPLRELAERNFDMGSALENVKHECDTGMCFV